MDDNAAPPLELHTSANIASRLTAMARRWPHQRAVVFPQGRDRCGRVSYTHLTFAQLDRETDLLALGLAEMGVKPGSRLVLMVRPSLEFIALTFALFKAGAVVVLIDPGMGKSGVFDCLDQVEPDGFVAVSVVQALRLMRRGRYPRAVHNVTVGRRWFWGGPNYRELRDGLRPADRRASVDRTRPFTPPPVISRDPAAVIFTSGSTGTPKGVLYEHGMFSAQVDALQAHFQIEPGEIDLPGFPLFALFNSAMGVTTVIPDMDPTRPARVNPVRIIEAIENQGVTQAFGSPAIWNRVSQYGAAEKVRLPSLKRVISAGAPVPEEVLRRMVSLLETDRATPADTFTPYGATEALPVSSIAASEVLTETAALTRTGKGTCVGRPLSTMRVRIIEITSEPIASIAEARELPVGEIGEIVVSGAVVTREYFRRPDATRLAKIPDGETFWHRMGDVGYFDETGRLWFCGRKAQLVSTAAGRMFTDCCEPVFNAHPEVFRTALVGVGAAPAQEPVIVVECRASQSGGAAPSPEICARLTRELIELGSQFETTRSIRNFLFHPSLPVDTRHNVKIQREKLAIWAQTRLKPPGASRG